MENEDFGAISSVRSLTNVTLFAVIRVDIIKARYLLITFLESLSILLHPVCVLGGRPLPTVSSRSPSLWLLIGYTS